MFGQARRSSKGEASRVRFGDDVVDGEYDPARSSELVLLMFNFLPRLRVFLSLSGVSWSSLSCEAGEPIVSMLSTPKLLRLRWSRRWRFVELLETDRSREASMVFSSVRKKVMGCWSSRASGVALSPSLEVRERGEKESSPATGRMMAGCQTQRWLRYEQCCSCQGRMITAGRGGCYENEG